MKNRKKIVGILLVILITLFLLIVGRTPPDIHGDLGLVGDGCLVLSYHRVISSNPLIRSTYKILTTYFPDDELRLYTVLRHDFEAQMLYLKQNGAHFITPKELESYVKYGSSLPAKSVLVTFDDVDVSVYNNAFPILQREQIPFTLFVITGHIGDRDFKGLQLSTLEQLQEMMDSDLATIGSHTHQFHYISKKGNPPFMDPENYPQFQEDMKQSLQALQDDFQVASKYFAYPYGYGTPKTDEILLDLGFDLIFTLKPGLVQKNDPAFFIKRVLVTPTTWESISQWAESPASSTFP